MWRVDRQSSYYISAVLPVRKTKKITVQDLYSFSKCAMIA